MRLLLHLLHLALCLHLHRLLFKRLNLIINDRNLRLHPQQLLLHHVLIFLIAQYRHRAPLALRKPVNERLLRLILTLRFQHSLLLEFAGIPSVEVVVSVLSCPAEQAEHDGSWDDISRASEYKTEIEASQPASHGGGADLVGEGRVQVISGMDWCASSDVPPVQQAGVAQDGHPGTPEGAADGEPLRSRDEGEQDWGLGAEGAVEGSDYGTRNCCSY
jgi:hypothetical protein